MSDPFKVLIVEDDCASLMMLEYLVGVLGLEAVTAENVADGRRLLAEKEPKIVILDVMLPDGEGTELLKEIRANNLPISVALITATHEKSKLYKCEAWKPDAMFAKPLVVNLVGEWIGQQVARIKMSECASLVA